MQTQRTITIHPSDDPDLRTTLHAFRQVQQSVSPACYNDGEPLGYHALYARCYQAVKGILSAQMTQTALRRVAGAYRSAASNRRPTQHPFQFKRQSALFLIGSRGRDARFCNDGTLSIWTVNGRKRLAYDIPAERRAWFEQAVEIDSLTVIERDGKLIGRLTLTLDFPDPQALHPVGIDLNMTNALVAVNDTEDVFFQSGRQVKVKNKRSFQTRKRLQRKLATRKAHKKDTKSIRRLLKRLGRSRSNRTKTFAQTAAKRLCQWAKPNSVLVFEALNLPPVSKKLRVRKGTRRKLGEWQHGLLRHYTECKAVEFGHVIAEVNPYRTSRDCSRCGAQGCRRQHRFRCPSCGHTDHADINAGRNIRSRYVALRSNGPPSVGPEALALQADAFNNEGKPPLSSGGH